MLAYWDATMVGECQRSQRRPCHQLAIEVKRAHLTEPSFNKSLNITVAQPTASVLPGIVPFMGKIVPVAGETYLL